jgi:hypothetical protein
MFVRHLAGNAARLVRLPTPIANDSPKGTQQMNSMKRLTAVSLLLSIGLLTIISSAFARQRVTVRSNNFRYNYHRIQVRGRVELANQLSNSPCDYGRSWGYDSQGIWVDDGCSAEFDVFDENEGRHRISGKTAGIIAGGVGAAILIGVLVARKKNNNNSGNATRGTTPNDPNASAKEKVPDWLVGTFTNDARQAEIAIYDDGTVLVKDGSRNRYYGNYYDGKLFYNGVKLQLAKDRNGFTATDLATNEQTYYERRK